MSQKIGVLTFVISGIIFNGAVASNPEITLEADFNQIVRKNLNSKGTSLNLESQKMGDEGVECLSNSSHLNSTLTSLNLWGNKK